MYMGDRSAARPMAIPPTRRARMKLVIVELAPVAQEDKKNTKAEAMSNFLRPYLSARAPAAVAPSRQPSRAILMASACMPSLPAIWK